MNLVSESGDAMGYGIRTTQRGPGGKSFDQLMTGHWARHGQGERVAEADRARAERTARKDWRRDQAIPSRNKLRNQTGRCCLF